MRSDEQLLFRGRATQRSPESPLIVSPHSWGSADASGALELSGGHAQIVAAALQLASMPTSASELSSLVAERCRIEQGFARDMLDHLVQHEILLTVVPVVDRLHVRGDRNLCRALCMQMKGAVWPSRAPSAAVFCLGRLGSPGWRESFHDARASAERALTWSVEGDGAWIGPTVNGDEGPCPACLVAWRTAADPFGLCDETVVAHNPTVLSAICQHVILRAEAWAAGNLADHEVLFVRANALTAHRLLRQPGCPHCSRANPDLSIRDTTLKSKFLADYAQVDPSEPSDAARAPFLDRVLGPIEVATYDAPDLFRGIPLCLGSLRMLLPRDHAFERRQLSSITFGAGMTESRRKLVAFAEGIERYALFVDRPDVTCKRLSELGPEALPPAETIRFAPEQFSGAAGAPVPYDDQPLDWSWAYDYTCNETRLLAHDFFTAAPHTSPGAVRWIDDPFSSGAAAHRSLRRAMRRALLELIERDALMLAWYLRLPLPELDVSTLANPEIRELCTYLTTRGIELSFFDLRVDFDVPTVLLIARASVDAGQWLAGGRIVSPSASASWDDAIIHSLHEILGHYSAFALVAPAGDSSLDPTTGEPHRWWPNFAAYFKPRADDPLSFLGAGAPRPVPNGETDDSVDELLTSLRAAFQARHLPAFIHYLAPEAVRQSGLVAVRACVPGLLRMTPSMQTVNFGEPRIDEIRSRWGAAPGLNPNPHPIS